MKKLYVMAIAMFVLLIGNAAVATIITVNGDGTADYTTIQDAIDVASNGDEIIVAPGTYTSTGDRVVDMDGKEITLRSSDGAATTIIDGGGTKRIVYCNSGETNNTIIDGFTITNAGIGGLYCTSDATITNCVFSNNYINGGGGGMGIQNGDPIIDNCTFSNNTGDSGGGLYAGNSYATITNCTFSNNNADFGGAVWTTDSSPVFTNCSFLNNTATTHGGAVYVSSFSVGPTITGCTFTSNTALFGGGVFVSNYSSIALVDCNFYTNSSTNETGSQYGGGAIMSAIAHIDLTDCNLVGNTAAYGGGICNHTGTATIEGCTFEENIANEGGGMINWNSAVVMTDSMFENNTATYDSIGAGGGGITNYFSEVAMTTCTLHNNHASNGTGGGMFSQSSSGPIQMTNCTVTNNTAKQWGGGLYATSADMILTDHTSSGNTAVKGDGAGIHASSSCLIVYMGTSSTDEIFIRNFTNNAASLSFSKDASCDVTGDVSTATGGSTTFDINNLSADEQLKVSNNFFRQGALGITNESGSLSDPSVSVGDIIPLAQAATLSGAFSSVTFPIMPSGLGLQLIEQSATSEDTEIAVKVVYVEEAEFSSPFTGDLDSPPLDVESFDANGDGIDEIVVLFGGAPGGIACFYISEDGAPVQIAGFTSTVGNAPVDLDVADLNDDGYDDVIVANGASNTVSVLTTVVGNDGSLSFDPEVVLSLSEPPTCVAIIDWDGETGLDAVVGLDTADTGSQDGYRVLLDVSGDSSDGPWFAIDWFILAGIAVPDPPTCVDGGKAVGEWGFVGGTRFGAVHRVSSAGSTILAETGLNTTTIEALHLNGRGDANPIDLMVASDEAEMIYLFNGNITASGDFDEFVPIAVSEPVEDILSLDADFDGDMDIVMLSPSSDTPLVLLRNDNSSNGFADPPMGTTWSKQEMESNETIVKMAAGDLDDRDEEDDWITVVGSNESDDGMFRDDPVGVIERTNLLRDVATCISDLNADGSVNVHDILILIGEWGASDSIADLNGDGIVNIHDLLILVGDWGACD